MKNYPEYTIRYSQRAKHLRLKVTQKDGLLVVVPRGYDEKKIPHVLKQKRVWLAKALERIGETKRFLEPRPVAHLPDFIYLDALGESWTIKYSPKENCLSGVRLVSNRRDELTLEGNLNRKAVIRKLMEWLRLKVREDLFPYAESLAEKHRFPIQALLVKNQRTRWASCSIRRNLSLNTKLLFLQPDIVRYVIIHELCHTVHMRHDKGFWRLVSSHEPRYEALDRSLREAWKSLPQWVF